MLFFKSSSGLQVVSHLLLLQQITMPRQAHGRSLLAQTSAKLRKSKPARDRGLNALETAEREFPQQVKIRQHRLGQAEDDDDEPNTRADADERSAKRRKVDHSVNDHDEEDGGSDLEGNQWHVGVAEDDDDSDIDSDEAFGESDEERFANFTFRGSSKSESKVPKQRPKQVKEHPLDLGEDDLDENSEAEGHLSGDYMSDGDELGEDAIDLAAAWDMDDEEQRKEQESASKRGGKMSQKDTRKPFASSEHSAASESERGSDESAEDEYEDFNGFELSEDEHDEETTARLRSFVDGLTPAEQVDVASKPRPSRNLPDRPSQFALPSAQISAADLMQYVTDPTHRQSLKILQEAEREDGTNRKGGIPGKLVAPLAKRQQDRLDRVAAYDQTKQTLERWVDTVKNNRRAEHVSFPLTDTTKASASGVKSLRPVLADQPQSELEAKIQEIMQESGYNLRNGHGGEDDEQRYEELKAKQIPLEEVQARRRDLRMQRELMFREEIRAKRIKKIKSKAYRRVHRKGKDKMHIAQQERLAAAGVVDSEEERERNDRLRAQERMGARHKESRWAKAAKATGQTTWNDAAKLGVNEMARRDEELRRRIEGKEVRDSDASGVENETESEYDSDFDDDSRWNERLDKLQALAGTTGSSRLAEMAFMKKAEAERRVQNDEEVRQLKRAIEGDDELSESNSDVEEERPSHLRFGKQDVKKSIPAPARANRLDFEERLTDDEDEVRGIEGARHGSETPINQIEPASQESRSVFTPRNITDQNTLKLSTTKTMPKQSFSAITARSDKNPQELALDGYTSPSESGGETNGFDAKTQLAIDVFAGDDETDLLDHFKKEKKQTVEDEGDQIIDNTLPGWGSWTGAGISKKVQNKAKRRFITTIKGVAPEARKDAKLDRVVINEKRIKKNGKYLAQELPHPFESRSQYERSLRLPMGPEWSTRNHFQDAIKPRVLMKQGQIIKAMAKPIA